MKLKPTTQELILVLMALVMGIVLRISHTDRMAVEHFDEAVYSSPAWYDSQHGQSYPMRHLYAPPLLPTMISICASVPGLSELAPFVPAMFFGVLTILVVWWMARSWFGMNAGLMIVFVVCCSDFHILFSRMAMTDVPALCWMCLAVGAASSGLQFRSVRRMAVAGVFTGLAWWTKYTGWLPLAIVLSGSTFWWLLFARRDLPYLTLLKLQATMVATAGLFFAVLLWQLQDLGGYSAVAANHRGYFLGFDGWQNRMADHIVYHFRLDSWLGAAALGIGCLAAGTQRWFLLKRSTWNNLQSSTPTGQPPTPDGAASPITLTRFIVAAVALTVMATGVGTFAILTCIGIGGIAGMFLWPTLANQQRRFRSGDQRPSDEAPFPHDAADLKSSPTIDPTLGVCLVTVWFAGMLLTTPMYHPYPRLSLPLLCSIWLAAAGGLSWWMESTISVARNDELQSLTSLQTLMRRLGTAMMMIALALTWFAGSLQQSWIWQDRTSLRDASRALGAAAVQHIAGTYERTPVPLHADEFGIIRPDPEDEYNEERELIVPPSAFEQLLEQVAKKQDTSSPLVDQTPPTFAVYAFGEPAVLKHLVDGGINAVPITDLNFGPATLSGDDIPTYFVFGPYALRTPNLMDSWVLQKRRFEHVDDFYFTPGEIVLFNLFSPKWIAQHENVAVQKLELYRLKPAPQG